MIEYYKEHGYFDKPVTVVFRDDNIQERSLLHHGTAILNIDNIDKIEGNYFTERGTVGHMVFTVCPQKT